ncbi:uncharacterized protein [Cicer arietinum]|uniref:Uncharacterized protein LOC101515289 n=1 Tax=Cicer arietinum TaxID=3827 RepID=A0A1S2YW67_CICAR|nr:uncharacterized protein LOC101515289 [Cicer arietinum]
MPSFNSKKGQIFLNSKNIADVASWYCAIVLIALILVTIVRDTSMNIIPNHVHNNFMENNHLFSIKPCDEIYVVGEGETLHTISDKCDDPFIVENNPHIHDPDDVFPGLVIKITPSHHC